METKNEKIRVSYDGKSHETQIAVSWFNNVERIVSAAKISSILLVVTVACVFIPILHFILVPVFLLLTIGAGVVSYMTTAKIATGEAPCPNCGTTFTLQNEPYRFPKEFRCRACSVTLNIEQLEY